MLSISERLKEFEKSIEIPTNGESAPGDFHVTHVNRIQNIQEEAERLGQTIATLEEAMEDFNKEKAELATELEESRKRARLLQQEVAARDQKLKEITQTRETSVRELEKVIAEKTKEIEKLKAEYHQNVRGLEEQMAHRDAEVQVLRKETGGLHQTIDTLEAPLEDFNRKSTEFKEQLEDSRSRLERLCEQITTRAQRKGKTQSDHDGDERSRKMDEEIQNLLVRYRQQLHERRWG
jgi:chromosome segregation ATPase